MAKMKLDSPFRSVRGRAGNFVFRKTRGQTFISTRPEIAPRVPTPAQTAAQERFRQAAQYAAEVLRDPHHRAEYERLAAERDEPVRSVLIADFLNPPEVTALDLTHYRGQVGDLIHVRASDDLEVVSVGLKITDAASGTVLEKGEAVKLHGGWSYTATIALPGIQPVTIAATAFDRPGHPGTAAKAYP